MKAINRQKEFETQFEDIQTRIAKAKRKNGIDVGVPISHEEMELVLSYMLCQDDGGYFMPNLQGCLPFPAADFYGLMGATNPKSIEEFTAIVSLSLAKFKSRKATIASIRENGLEMTIHSFESFHRLLALYELPDGDAQTIVADILGHGYLNEWEELILESHEVPSGILNQFPNIVSLPSEADSSSVVTAIIEASYMKLFYGCPIEDDDSFLPKEGSVGPFFHADGKVISKKLPVDQFEARRRFFDVDTPHMELFEGLGLDGDYGNYPRGRVLYDNFHRRFVVYADTVLLRKGIKEEIKRHFGLDGQRVVFRKDEHYAHDGL